MLRRNPVRAQEVRDTRHAKLATLQAHVAKQNHYLTDHPRAHAQGALQKLVARAEKLRIAEWVELILEERTLTLQSMPVRSTKPPISMAAMCSKLT